MGRLGTLLVLLAVLMGGRALADVRLPHVFGDHMVLQRRKPVPVWGWASAGEKLTIVFNGQTKTARAAKDGRWRVQLDPMEAGGPYQLVVTGKTNTVQINDVLLGEVWLCSGQSNMEFSLQGAANGPADIRKANYPTIRQLLVTKAKALTPQSDINGSWAVCSPATAATFSAVGYYFARALQDRLQVPIGIINSSWGGTHAETWTSREALNRDTTLRYMVADMPATYDEAADRSKARLQALLQEQQGGAAIGRRSAYLCSASGTPCSRYRAGARQLAGQGPAWFKRGGLAAKRHYFTRRHRVRRTNPATGRYRGDRLDLRQRATGRQWQGRQRAGVCTAGRAAASRYQHHYHSGRR